MAERETSSGRRAGWPWSLGPAVWLATGSYAGFAPLAPGTVGSLWGLPLAWGLGRAPWWAQLPVIVLLAAAGIPLCTAAAKRLGDKKDPGAIVFDEIASLPMTFFLVPMAAPSVVLAGFVLNRFFDILKPPPANYLEKLPDGLGIMADDWIAGVYSCLALHALLALEILPPPGG